MNDQSFLQAIFAKPNYDHLRLVYADWLDDQGEGERAEFLRLNVAVRTSRARYPRLSAEYVRMEELRAGFDPVWAMLIDDFDGHIREVRPVQLRIETHGKAPKRYGKGVYRVGHFEMTLLVRAGWRNVGRGLQFEYVRPPEGIAGENPVITALVPTDAEIERLGTSFHNSCRSSAGPIGGWYVRYQTREESRPAWFTFGWGPPWSVTLLWDKGNQNAPTWQRFGEPLMAGV